MRHSPLEIEVMLQCFYTADLYYSDITEKSPAHCGIWKDLVQANLVETYGNGTVKVTDRGAAWVDMICRTPKPHKAEIWTDPRTGEEVKFLS